MKTHRLLAVLLLAGLLPAQQSRLVLGRLSTGSTAAFTRSGADEWGLEVAGGESPRIAEAQPVRLEVFTSEQNVRQLASGYKTVESAGGSMVARAEISAGSGVTFRVEDRWTASGQVISVRRKVEVGGSAPGGFYSAVMLTTGSDVTWPDADYLAPGMLYADPTHDGDRAPGGALSYAARRLSFREDYLAAPLFALSFRNGTSIAVLDPSPRGDTTTAESEARGDAVMTDARFQFRSEAARGTKS